MTAEVVEIETTVNTVVVEGDPSPTSVVIEVLDGVALVDDEAVGSAVGSVEVTDVGVQSVEILGGPDLEVVEVGISGPPGAQGPPGTEPDLQNLTILFENGLI